MTKRLSPGSRLRPKGGVLLVISAMLLGSALLRFGVEAGPALTNGISSEINPVEDPIDSPAVMPRPTAPEDLSHVLAALQKRESRLEERERTFEARMKALSLADAEVSRKLAALRQAEEELRDTLTRADGAAEGDLARLTGMYERMKPKEAAALFEEMAPEFAAGFLARMQPEAATSVMAGLSPKTAYTISVVLAGRNTSVPKE